MCLKHTSLKCFNETGLVKNSSMPALKASCRSLSEAAPVIAMIGTRPRFDSCSSTRILRDASNPSMTGIEISVAVVVNARPVLLGKKY